MALDSVVRTYDPKQIIVTFGGVIFTGFAAGTFLTITQNGDDFEKERGSDGTVDRINKNSDDYSIAATIKQTSLTNDALSVIRKEDKLFNTGKKPFAVKDLNGNSLFFALFAWIRKAPDPDYGDALTNREWGFDTGPAEQFIGGNIL